MNTTVEILLRVDQAFVESHKRLKKETEVNRGVKRRMLRAAPFTIVRESQSNNSSWFGMLIRSKRSQKTEIASNGAALTTCLKSFKLSN